MVYTQARTRSYLTGRIAVTSHLTLRTPQQGLTTGKKKKKKEKSVNSKYLINFIHILPFKKCI